LNKTLRKILDDNKAKIPDWFTANFITYLRTVMVVPTLLFLAWDYTILPCFVVISVDFGDFLDGVVARFWVDVKKEREAELQSKDKKSDSPSPSQSDDESFEVVTTGSPQTLPSWLVLHRNRTYGGFVDAVCDKAFVIPCWISLLRTVSSGYFYLRWAQYFTLVFLILAEVASGCIRFRAYFAGVAVPTPKVEGFDFSSSAVKADFVGKAKQTFEMLGTALYVLPWARYLGLPLLILAVPLAYESVRRKINQRVLYVNGKVEKLDHKTLKFWMQAKAMGSKLIIGFAGKKTDMILNACACSCVDEVVAEAPEKLDLMFLEKQKIDYVIASAGEPLTVTDEVVNAGRCLEIGEDGVARLYKLKDAAKKE
jgi:phosphatidylglycerophosphate synthase